METLARLERVDRELTEKWRWVSVALDTKDGKLSFSSAEEAELEEGFSDAIGALQKALQDAEDFIAELTDPAEVAETWRSVKFFSDQTKRHVVNVRKLLVAYTQRAKLERHEQARSGLMGKRTAASGDKKEATSGSASDVTASLKRTRQVMAQEVDRVGTATKVLESGRVSLRSTHEEFGGVQAEIGQWQARQDRMWIGAGIAILVATVLFIVYERTGLLIM